MYKMYTEQQLLDLYPYLNGIEQAVTAHIEHGFKLISVSYKGGCKATGTHIYHFLDLR